MSRRPKLGQHFLVDRSAIGRIIDAVSLAPGEPLLEIGPGPGTLTRGLVDAAGTIAAVELDHELAERLEQRFDRERLVLFRDDARTISFERVALALGYASGTPLVIVGNLPYAISKPICQRLVGQRELVARAVLMFQREVAERIVAQPGGRDYGPLSVLVQAAYSVRPLLQLAPRAFRPPPRVRSTVTLWERREHPELRRLEPALRACLAASFARRRRTLRNNLRGALGSDSAADALLEAAGLDGSDRPERIDCEGFLRLAAVWGEHDPLV